MTTNPIKAEKQLRFGQTSYKARMSVDTSLRIEESTGFSILKVGQKLSTGDLTLLETINILTLSIRAGGNDINENTVKGLVSEIGLVESIKQVGELLALALNVDTQSTSNEKKN